MILMWIILVLAVAFDAIGDVYVFIGKMWRGKLFQALMVASFLGAMVLAHYLPQGTLSWPGMAYLVLMYAFIRAGLFNPIWGHFGLKMWHYLGTTSYFDRMLIWITDNIKWKGKIIFVRKPFLTVFYFFCFLLSVGVLFQYFLS
jgi:hypothetical protein